MPPGLDGLDHNVILPKGADTIGWMTRGCTADPATVRKRAGEPVAQANR